MLIPHQLRRSARRQCQLKFQCLYTLNHFRLTCWRLNRWPCLSTCRDRYTLQFSWSASLFKATLFCRAGSPPIKLDYFENMFVCFENNRFDSRLNLLTVIEPCIINELANPTVRIRTVKIVIPFQKLKTADLASILWFCLQRLSNVQFQLLLFLTEDWHYNLKGCGAQP